jgi:hypothetical protein
VNQVLYLVLGTVSKTEYSYGKNVPTFFTSIGESERNNQTD